MLAMLCEIPENVGWAIVGAVAMLALVMAIKVGKIVVIAIKERMEDEEEEEC